MINNGDNRKEKRIISEPTPVDPTEEISYEGLYNGNIAGIENIYAGDTFTNEYTFTYDGMNRLTQAYTTNNNAYMEEAGYDLNGNISELVRAGKHNDGTYKLIDALMYSYNGNQIQSVQDAGGALVYDGSFDFKPSGSTEAYRFNANGAMTYDPNKGITINYSDWGSPSSITFDSGNSTEYIYGADGRKLKVSWSSNSANCKPTSRFYDDEEEPGSGSGGNTGGGSQGSTTGNIVSNSMEYVGPFIIIEDSLSRIRFDGGYCTVNGNQAEYHYYVKDHLGSNRLVVDENGNVEQKTYYYPFGGVYGDISTNTDVQSYKFNGKELDHRHGLDLYDYGARMYDPAVGSWTSLDPLAEKYYNVSPYAYCHNNPMNAVDPDGRSVYMLFYTKGSGENDDSMFRVAAETRKHDIMNDNRYDSNKDIVILQSVSDLSKIGNLVDNIVNKYSKRYGNTAEFSFWSHSGLDGPIGTIPTSNNALDKLQMTLQGWSNINFNWEENASAYFYGCRSGVSSNGYPSFTTELSARKNFHNVNIYGQNAYSYPSIYTNRRVNTLEMIQGNFSYPTYMVGGKMGEGWRAFYPGVPVPSMRRSYNGRGNIGNYYQPGKKY